MLGFTAPRTVSHLDAGCWAPRRRALFHKDAERRADERTSAEQRQKRDGALNNFVGRSFWDGQTLTSLRLFLCFVAFTEG